MLAVALLVPLAACTAAGGPGARSAEPSDAPAPAAFSLAEAALDESAAVVRTVERFHDALATGDTATVLSLLLPGSRIVEGGRVETREQYASHHLAADVGFLGRMESEDTRIHAWVEGDVAWAVSTTHLRGAVGDEPDVALASTELAVLVRHPEDGWRIAAVHWSSRRRDDGG